MDESKSRKRAKNELVLGDLSGKVSKDSNITQSERALVNVGSGTLYFPLLLDGISVGGVFLGFGYFIVDAIVETKQGAIGQSEEHKWDGSLLLLDQGRDWSAPSTEPAEDTDLRSRYLESAEEAKERAWQIFDRFMRKSEDWSSDFLDSKEKGWLANIIDNEGRESHLMAKRDRLVMIHEGTKLVIKGNKLVRKEPEKTLVVSRRGRIIRIG
ncbi:MAG: hypothetical protein ACFFBS_01365 [Promethearchaeota archaeon]